MLSKKVPLVYVLIITAVVCVVTYFGTVYELKAGATIEGIKTDTDNEADYNILRDPRNYKYISPIISIEPVKESEKYAALKTEIGKYIDEMKQNGAVISTAVYVRDFAKGGWMAINVGERYNPGSLLKVGVLITYLRMAEADSYLLRKEVTYRGQKGFVFPVEYYKNDTVVEGKKYKINDLLTYMIKYSDNRATVFLENMMDTVIFKKEFADLGITMPRFDDPTYSLNVKEYSAMFKALYNAGYLRKRASENALALLAESTFKNGLLKELPPTVTVAHKFGEAGDMNIHELHESGIIYLHGNPYLITVMTKGTDWSKLSETIGHISKMVYDNMSATMEGHTNYQTKM